MSSRVWAARNSGGACGLSKLGCSHEGKITAGDLCFYLTIAGTDARPESQISVTGERESTYRGRTRVVSIRETPDGREFRSVPTGDFRCRRNSCAKVYSHYRKWCSCRAKVQRIYKWQEKRGDRWHDVTVWENAVHADCARAHGFIVPGETTVAAPGTRTVGHAHTVQQTPESPMADLARAGLEDDAVLPNE